MEHFGIEYWLFTFCIYCMAGWVQESTIESLYHRRPINRGFLRGPYIPIYGVGGLLLLFICHPFRDNGFQVFFVALIALNTSRAGLWKLCSVSSSGITVCSG